MKYARPLTETQTVHLESAFRDTLFLEQVVLASEGPGCHYSALYSIAESIFKAVQNTPAEPGFKTIRDFWRKD